MIPCSQMQCNRRPQELGFSLLVREARDLHYTTATRGSLKTFRIAPKAAAMQFDDRNHGPARRITRQSEGRQSVSLSPAGRVV